MIFCKYLASKISLILKTTITFVFLFFVLSCTKFPLPDPAKKDTLLIIPVSITSIFKMNHFDKFGLTFVRDNYDNKLKFIYSLSHYQNKDYILIENIEPGTYYVHSVSFISGFGEESEYSNEYQTYHDVQKGFERRNNHGNFQFSKKRIRFELTDNHVTIPKFKIEFWNEKRNGMCCSVYLYLINNIDDLSRNQLIDKLKDSESFNKWKIFLPKPAVESIVEPVMEAPKG